MPNNTTTISSFGQTPGLTSLFLVVAAVLLTILAALFLVAGALLGFIAHEHTARMPYAMFMTAVVLLVLILALLLLLLWVVIRGAKEFPIEFLTVLPILSQLPGALKAMEKALRAGATGLNLIQSDISAAGRTLVNTADNAPGDFEIRVPYFETERVPDTTFYYVKGVNMTGTTVSLSDLKIKLKSVGDSLQFSATFIDQAESDLASGADALKTILIAIGSPP